MRRTIVLVALLLPGAPGCTSRTLPLPPPVIEAVSAPGASGEVTLRGIAQEGASIGVMNEATGQGIVHTSPDQGCGGSCAFEVQVQASGGDHLRVWQFESLDNNVDVQVPE